MTTSLPTALVLASGRGERFLASGGRTHKLRALLSGKAVLDHVLDAVRASGLPWHLEDAGHPGMGDSIAAAVHATPSEVGWLILPGDLPLIQPATLQQMALALVQADGRAEVIVPVHQGQRGHPVAFAAACRQALRELRGDRGAAAVIRAWRAIEMIVDDIGCVTDVDTVQALAQAQAVLDARPF